MARNVLQALEVLQDPLTAEAFAALCEERAWYCGPVPLHVQVRKHGMTICARVVEVKPGQMDWFRLDAGAGPFWATSQNVRACSGVGICQCEAEARTSARACRASAFAVPLGNTGTTTGAVL